MEKDNSKISRSLYNEIFKLTSENKFLSARFVPINKGCEIYINGVYRNKEFKYFEDDLESWFYDNEFMFGGTIFPIINEGQLTLKILFEISSNNDIDSPWDFSALFESVCPVIQKQLNISFIEDNLFLTLVMSKKHNGLKVKKYSVVYRDGGKKIKFTDNHELREVVVDFTSKWCKSNIYELSATDLSYNITIVNSVLDEFVVTWSKELVLIIE